MMALFMEHTRTVRDSELERVSPFASTFSSGRVRQDLLNGRQVTTPALEVTGTLEHQQGVLNVLGTGFVPLREVRAPTRTRSFR